jgi:hypothetical protein
LSDEPSIHPPVAPPTGNVLLRVVWMGAIPFILLCIFLLADTETWTLGTVDIVLVLLVVGAVVARAIDALSYGGTTADGEPATRSHVIRYAIRVVVIAAVAWVIAQSIAL